MQDSRLYSFLDAKNNFTVRFLEGQKLIVDLVQTHNLEANALNYYRETLLSTLHLCNFLKPGENIGIYIDSENPYFRFKVELHESGDFRTLLLPEQFDAFPKKITGICRISKIFPQKRPYTSVIQISDQAADSLINSIFEQSYQTNSQVITSEVSDQSFMVTKLPPININQVNDESMGLNEYLLTKKKLFSELFIKGSTDVEEIVKFMENDSFAYLGSKQMKLTCSCSKERMVNNLLSLGHNDLNEVFNNKENVEVRCDYCNTVYTIAKSDLAN